MSKRTDSRLGSLATGALTAASLALVSGVAAVTGVVIAQEFGRTEETDGLLAAYGVFIVLGTAALAIRLAVLPPLTRARSEQRLAGELVGFMAALLVVAVPVLLVALVGADWLAALLTGDESEIASETAADALVWIVPAGLAHVFAGLAASGLAALDDYATAAFGHATGAIAGLALILLRVEPDGIVAVAWGVALNGAITMLVPSLALVLRAVRARMPVAAARPTGLPLPARLGAFAVGAALPLALQLLYLVCLAFASRLDTGDATSFVYAYLAGSALVAVTAGSLGMVTSVPLSRAELGAAETTTHVAATTWLALVVVGAAAGVFALAGGSLVEAALGSAFSGEIGSELGRLVVALSPWMVASIGVWVTFPLAFVAGRTRRLPAISAGRARVAGAARMGRRGVARAGRARALARPDDAARPRGAPPRARRARGGGAAARDRRARDRRNQSPRVRPAGGGPRVVRGGGCRARAVRRAPHARPAARPLPRLALPPRTPLVRRPESPSGDSGRAKSKGPEARPLRGRGRADL